MEILITLGFGLAIILAWLGLLFFMLGSLCCSLDPAASEAQAAVGRATVAPDQGDELRPCADRDTDP